MRAQQVMHPVSKQRRKWNLWPARVKSSRRVLRLVCTLGRFGQLQLMGSVRNGFSMDWGPVSFTKAKHPPSIMVRLVYVQFSC